MRIAIFTQFLKSGGAEKRASVFTNYFFSKGLDVVLVTMHKMDDEYYVNPNIPRYYVADSKEEYLSLSKKQRLQRLRSIYLDVMPEKIISFMPIFACYTALATKFCKKLKQIEIYYAVALYQRKYPLIERLIDIFTCIFSNKIILQCNEQKKCNWLYKRKCIVSYNPIDAKESIEHNNDFSNLNIISIGRLTKQKNFEFQIKVIAELHDLDGNVTLDIYGNGPLKEKLENIIAARNAIDYIHLHPFSTNLNEEMSKYNIFVSSSKYEGFPNALVESMMNGLVCLSTPCPSGPKEIIEDKVNGFLFKNKKQLIDQLSYILKNNNVCKTIANNARDSVISRFETSIVLNQLVNNILDE